MNKTNIQKRRSSSFSINNKNTKHPHFKNRAKVSRGKRTSNLDPNRLIQKATGSEETIILSSRTFNDAPIDARLITNLADMGFTHPTQIQTDTLESLIEGRDLVGIANTGTGKTAALLCGPEPLYWLRHLRT